MRRESQRNVCAGPDFLKSYNRSLRQFIVGTHNGLFAKEIPNAFAKRNEVEGKSISPF